MDSVASHEYDGTGVATEKRTEDPEVLIVGAGPTGLMLALWLIRLDVKVKIVDTKAGPTTETRALSVHARTMEFYDQLGLGPEILRRGRGRTAERVSLWRGKRRLAQLPLKSGGQDVSPHPYTYIFPQDHNEAMLLKSIEALNGAVQWETELIAFTQDEVGVTATLRRVDGSETVRAAYLAGCDGTRSAVRRLSGITFSGETPGTTFFVTDATVEGEMFRDDFSIRFEKDTFLLTMPMPGNRHRIVGQLPEGVSEPPTFEDIRPSIEGDGLARVGRVHWFSSYRVHHRVADKFRSGRAFLLGDAGHAHSPVGGQGMNTGLGDAVNLGWKLAQTLRGGDPAVLDTYEAERRPFAVSLVNTTDRLFSTMTRPTALARVIKTVVVPTVLPPLMHLRTVSRLFFLTTSQTRLHYPKSPLSSGQAGKVRGGDRLPWVKLKTGSNFDALQSLTWQVHVYGPTNPALHGWGERRGLTLHTFPYTAQAARAGLERDALYVVRPDGYVGLAAPRFEPSSLDAYAERWLPNAGLGTALAKEVNV